MSTAQLEVAPRPITGDVMSKPTTLTWSYGDTAPRVTALYLKSARDQWNAETDIEWTSPIEFGQALPAFQTLLGQSTGDTPLSADPRVHSMFHWEFQRWMISQFLHGEQGALVSAARLAEVLPDVQHKLYASSQAFDEARHVHVFARYIDEFTPGPYAADPALAQLLADTLSDSRWDFVALGMQVLVEGLAMGAFRMAEATFADPLLRRIITLVMRDEARHVSYGALALDGIAEQLSNAERREREEFILEGAALIRKRFLLWDLWEQLGVSPDAGTAFAATDPRMVGYRQTLFAKVVPLLRRTGHLSPAVVAGLNQLGLLGPAGRRAAGEAVTQ